MSGFKPVARLGLVAGGGDLPCKIVRERQSQGLYTSVVRIQGSTDGPIGGESEVEIGVGRIGHIVARFKQDGCTSVCFAGYVTRPDFGAMSLDMKGIALLPRVLAAARQGDSAILGVLVAFMEENGLPVVAPEVQLQGATPDAGILGRLAPDDEAAADLRKAARIARAIGQHDIGQGAIVCAGLVLAVEAQEGTDGMLARVATLRAEIRGTPSQRRGVLFKAPMPQQDRRIDLPTIGSQTVERAAEAGLAGIGIEAGGAILLDRDRLVETADRLGLFLVALDASDIEGANRPMAPSR